MATLTLPRPKKDIPVDPVTNIETGLSEVGARLNQLEQARVTTNEHLDTGLPVLDDRTLREDVTRYRYLLDTSADPDHDFRAHFESVADKKYAEWSAQADKRNRDAVATFRDLADDADTQRRKLETVQEQLDEATEGSKKSLHEARRRRVYKRHYPDAPPEHSTAGSATVVRPGWWSSFGYWVFLALAVLIDIVTFQGVLSLVLPIAGDLLIWIASIAVAMLALDLARRAGKSAKERELLPQFKHPLSSPLFWTLFAGWSLIGAVGFYVRLKELAPPTTIIENYGTAALPAGLATSSVGPAVLFLILYVATGMLAMTGSFAAWDPDGAECLREQRTIARLDRLRSQLTELVATAIKVANRSGEDADRADGSWDGRKAEQWPLVRDAYVEQAVWYRDHR